MNTYEVVSTVIAVAGPTTWAVINQFKINKLTKKINIQADYAIELKDVRKQKDLFDLDFTISSKL